MKKTCLFCIVSLLFVGNANAAICKLIPTKCYTTMGAGYLYNANNPEPDSWDITSNCWGKKYICAEALTATYRQEHNINSIVADPVALGRKEIAVATNSEDFDMTILNGDCFGSRIVKDGGAQMKVDGNYVNVWCSGVLDDVNMAIKNGPNIKIDNTFDNGDITLGTQPTCTQLADAGYVNIQNGRCYGKNYDTDEYAILCDAGGNPSLVVLNGVDRDNITATDIKTKTQANERLETMYINAKKLHKQYFRD